MAPPAALPPRIRAIAFITPSNAPILVRSYAHQNELQCHYIAHMSLDVIEERAPKATDCYLGHLYSMEDVAVYGYITATRVKIVIALALADAVVKDGDIIAIFKALHTAYYQSLANPFLQLSQPVGAEGQDYSLAVLAGGGKWKGLRMRVDAIRKAVGAADDD
ncbi:hypothetical protein BOTBODRAFT_59910 [Botryobasidium botryosum FD-172 SS1]|uniref:Trafficking protein particle complex subunit 2-like protein n=1 Tax=Botryobasidium botryosum (strain FD-172 SS1) TaxID=930990 RepID=A0A067M6L0_BOTB1|nr:hypothetical protein BOTBODRAFT_59910 [Botryobasidium botryosum FD-172 SS1]